MDIVMSLSLNNPTEEESAVSSTTCSQYLHHDVYHINREIARNQPIDLPYPQTTPTFQKAVYSSNQCSAYSERPQLQDRAASKPGSWNLIRAAVRLGQFASME